MCPQCQKPFTDVKVIELTARGHSAWRAVGYACPHCDTVISIQKNPFTIDKEAMHEISRSSSVILKTLVQEVAVLRAEIELLEHLVTEKMQR
jgi:hypothetical protein